MPYRPKWFGQIVGADLKFVHDAKGDTYSALNIVDFAKENRVGVAVRTGGHQYSGKFLVNFLLQENLFRLSLSGASSTSGENILVDLSDTFQDPEADFQYVEETNMLRVGISFSLKEVDWF